jgi:hypothetical protein
MQLCSDLTGRRMPSSRICVQLPSEMRFSDSEMVVGAVCCRAGGGGLAQRGQIAPVEVPESLRGGNPQFPHAV